MMKFEEIMQVNNIMNKIQYGFLDGSGNNIFDDLNVEFVFDKVYHLMSPEELLTKTLKWSIDKALVDVNWIVDEYTYGEVSSTPKATFDKVEGGAEYLTVTSDREFLAAGNYTITIDNAVHASLLFGLKANRYIQRPTIPITDAIINIHLLSTKLPNAAPLFSEYLNLNIPSIITKGVSLSKN